MKANTAWIGASVAVLAAGAVISYNRKSWPFSQSQQSNQTPEKSGSNAAPGADKGSAAPAGAAANVDVALTNEVASYTEHNPNNAADFTDDGATGNAD
ncbi:hypothetical protein [Hymenobacter weizhouensis]|uniref:hypothetical protein n=1 Tax=Hymenobacter sp. YIM 151500-1 TaxID=2987689 RepID=UPI00222600AC|nr:hypothetical protein [Hymenobacter sp. YIM 151500-1]UYZ63189.1 hypothetical protein OIS53_19630 [Hymenobacter sp. YIM 151500-1]